MATKKNAKKTTKISETVESQYEVQPKPKGKLAKLAPKLPKKPPAPSQEDAKAQLRRVVAEYEALTDESKASGAAWVSGTRLAVNLRKEIEEMRNPKGRAPATATDDYTEAQLIEALTQCVVDLPEEALDQLDAAIDAKRNGRPLLREVR